MIRSESILTRPMPPENGSPAQQGEQPRRREDNVNPFVAQQVVDMDAMRKQKRPRIGRAGREYFLSLWCFVPAAALLGWCGFHAYLGYAAGAHRETVIAIATGAGATLAAFGVAFGLAKALDPARTAASAAFSAIVAVTAMASIVRVVATQPQVAAATPISAWVMEPFLKQPQPSHEFAQPGPGQGDDDVAMQQLADRMRVGTIDTSKVGKHADKDEKSDIRLTVRKRKPVTADGELAEAKEGE